MSARFPFLLFLMIIFSQLSAQAQETGQQNSLLPEINPQDIEIRSEFQARFPGLRRQPILGFNPKPRVYQINPNRMPFLESREEAVAGIEMTQLNRPEPPVQFLLKTPENQNIYALAGLGNYNTAEAEVYTVQQWSDSDLFAADLNFYSTQGHLEEESSGRFVDAQAQYIRKINRNWKFKADAGLLSDKYHMFETVLSGIPEKTNFGSNVNFNLQKINNAFSGLEFQLGGTLFNSDLPQDYTSAAPAPDFEYGGELKEKTWYAGFRTYWPGERMYEEKEISVQYDGGTYNSITDENWMHIKTAFKYERLLNFKTRITGRGGIHFVSDVFSQKFYLVPEIALRHTLTPALTVTANAFARPEFSTTQQHQQMNRFIDSDLFIRHSYNLGVAGKISFSMLEGNSLYGGLSYNYIQNFNYYIRDDFGPVQGFYGLGYDDVNIFEIQVGVAQQLIPEKFHFNARIYGRNPSLSNGDDIPFEERIGIEGSLHLKPVDAFAISTWADYTGKRKSSNLNVELDPFVLINGKAEYRFNEKFGVYIKVLNILGQNYEYWDGYLERPFQIFGGVTLNM